jgi:hypothetical protein
MEARIRTTPSALRAWKVLACAGALGTLLVLSTPPAKADPPDPSPRTATKCRVDGVTTYSDKPCPYAIGKRQVQADTAPPASAASEARSSPAVRIARCDAAEAELRNIDALTKQGQPPDMQAFLDARRQQKRNEQFRYRC